MGGCVCGGTSTEAILEEGGKRSSAFVFIKPHAVTGQVKELVQKALAESGIRVKDEGKIPSEQIDKQGLIDVHYGSIAARCVREKPAQLKIDDEMKDEFLRIFGLSWADALSQSLVFNGQDAAARLGMTPDSLATEFDKLPKQTHQIKFSGGFYCGKMRDIFVINGFYYRMRKVFTQPGKGIHYYEVEWDAAKLSWADFREKVVGFTDPKQAIDGSIRNRVLKDFLLLGLSAPPTMGNNAVHASASPFEALAERKNWLQRPVDKDYFGKALIASGITQQRIDEWTHDPNVICDNEEVTVYELFEDMDGKDVLDKAKQVRDCPK